MEVEILGSLGAADGWREVSEALDPCAASLPPKRAAVSAGLLNVARLDTQVWSLLFLYPTLYHGPFLLQAPEIIILSVSVIPAARRFFQLLQVFSRTVSDSTVKAATSQGKVPVILPATARQISKTHNRLSKPSKIRCIKIQQVIPIGPQNEQKHRLTGTTTTAKQIKLRLPVPRRCWPSVLLVPRRRWLSGVCSRVRPPAPRVLGLYYYYLARHRSLLCGSHRRRRRSRQR